MSVFALTNCTKEIESPILPDQKGEPFELYAATPKTKTVNEGVNTKWEVNDKIAVFYGDANALPNTYSAGQVFTCDVAESGHFTGTLDANHELAATNDWYAFYSSAIDSKGVLQNSFKTPMKSSWLTFGARTDYSTPQVQKQNGVNSTAHIAGINYPLYGEVKAVEKSKSPSIKLSHLSSLIKIQVRNDSGQTMNVTNIELETPSSTPIVGLFTYEVIDGKTTLTPVAGNAKSGNPNSSNIARLDVTGAEIAVDATASFYLGTAPFVLEAGQVLKSRVNGIEKSLNLSSRTEFKSGAIKDLPVLSYTAKAPEMKVGKYVIAAKDENGDYYAMKNTPKSSRLDQLNLGNISNITAIYEALDKSILWDVVAATNGKGFAIKDQNGKFLSWTSGNGAITAVDELVLTGIGHPRGFFQIQFPEPTPSTVTRALAWNKTSSGFAFYDAAKTTMDTKIYLIPAELTTKTPLAAPVVTATPDGANAKIAVSWEAVPNATSYEVTCTGQTAVNVTGTTAEFTGLTLGETYEITVTAKGDATKYIAKTSNIVSVVLVAAGTKSFSLTIGNKAKNLPQGVSTTTEHTYTKSATQMTKGNSQTYTIKGMVGKTITGVTLDMRSNKSSGAGYLTLKAGTQILATIGSSTSGIAFNKPAWNNAWNGVDFAPVDLTMSNANYKIQSGEDVVLKIGATANSLYCSGITVFYIE